MSRISSAVVMATLVACGSGTTQPTGPQQFEQAQKPVSPKSIIVGRVIDAATQAPLDGVSVRALGFDPTTTASDGFFRLGNVVAGSTVTFVFEKAGYVRRVTSASTPSSAGNSPLEGGLTSFSVDLFPGTCSVGGVVFLPNGRPAGGATVSVDQSQQGYGESVVSAQTSADGSFSLAGLACRPAGAFHRVAASWFDENGDMLADYAGTEASVTLYPGQPGRVFLTYQATSIGNRIVASNIGDGEVAPGEDLSFTFALPLLAGSLDQDARGQAQLFNVTRGNVAVPVELTFMSATQLRVRPANMSLREGERYRLELRLRNANGQSGTTSDFFASLAFQVRPAVSMPFNVVVPGVTVQNPLPVPPFGVERFNFDSNAFTVAWSQTPGAVRYEVFARDPVNPNYVFLASADATQAPRQQLVVQLPPAFDVVPGIAGIQPLAFGNTVTFAVAAVDVYGNRSPLMMAMPVTVRDEIPPTLTSGPALLPDALGGSGLDAINETAVAQSYRIRLTYSEPMDTTAAGTPTFTVASANAPMTTWVWDPADASQRSVILTLTIPPNSDASGSFVIRGGRDSSNNAVAQAGDIVGTLGGRRELLQNGNFQMGNTCSLAGWTPSNTNSAPLPITVPNNGAIVGTNSPCAALLGSVPGTQPSTGRSRIAQNVTLPSTSMSGFQLVASVRARHVFAVNQGGPGAAYTMGCRIETTGGGLLASLTTAVAGPVGNVLAPTFDVNTVNITAQNNTTVSFVCDADNGTMFLGNGAYYVDEASVALVRTGTL